MSSQLLLLLKNGVIDHHTKVWKGDWSNWRSLSACGELLAVARDDGRHELTDATHSKSTSRTSSTRRDVNRTCGKATAKSNVVFYEQRDGTPSKAILVEHLQDLFASGVISERTKVWKDGWADWRKLGACKELLTLVDVGDGAAAHDKTQASVTATTTLSAAGAPAATVARAESGSAESKHILTAKPQDISSHGQASTTAGAAKPSVVFYEQRDGTPSKAILVEHLQDLFASGVISERTKVWKDGWADWRKLGACKELLTPADAGDGAAAHDKTRAPATATAVNTNTSIIREIGAATPASSEKVVTALEEAVAPATAHAENKRRLVSKPQCTSSHGASTTAGAAKPSVVFYEQRDGSPSKAILVKHLQEMVALGEVTGETRVWCTGMRNWDRLQDSDPALGLMASPEAQQPDVKTSVVETQNQQIGAHDVFYTPAPAWSRILSEQLDAPKGARPVSVSPLLITRL